MRLVGTAVMLLGILIACSNTPTSPASYVVAYEVTATAGASYDSVTYDDGHGSFVKVNVPSSGWLVAESVATGGTVEAHAWGVASGGGQAVKLKATWTLSGVSSSSDSSGTTTSAPGRFTLDVAKHQL
jgi:hypothetical protein